MMRPVFRTILLCAAFFGLAASTDAQTYQKLYSFPGGLEGDGPAAPLIQAADGFFYGTTENGGAHSCGTAFRTDGTSTPTILHSFTYDEGCNPTAALLQGSDGLFYGVARGGGRLDDGNFGDGTLFTMNSNGEVTVLHVFQSGVADNGGFPYAALIQATDGFFYGTTRGGGAHYEGTVFRVSATGEFVVLHSFDPSTGGGAQPWAPLIQATDGMFYGTTLAGGNPCGEEGCDRSPGGTVFQMDASGNVSYRFNFHIGGGNGDSPIAGLLQTSPTTFMGTTSNLGSLESSSAEFAGTIFVLDTSEDWFGLYTVHGFELSEGFPGGAVPVGGLMQASDGNIYGTTLFGGSLNGPNGHGVVFRRNAAGEVTVVHAFDGDSTDGDAGSMPSASLVQGTDGQLYGTAAGGFFVFGAESPGTLFRLNFAPAKTDQTITFAVLADKTFGGPDFSIGATASSGLTVTFAPSGNCTMSGTMVHLTGVGSCTITANQAGNASYNPAPSVPRSFTIAAAPTPKLTLSLSSASATGGSTVTATVTLTSPAPAGGAIVTLASSTPGAAKVPASMSIAKGNTTKTFTVTTLAVAAATPVTISASYGGTTAWSGLTVNPPALSGLTLTPNNGVKGGTPATAKVTLNAPAPAGGLLVTLTSAKPAVAASTSVVVPAGAKSANVAITTFKVTANTTVDITATGGGVSQSATLAVKK
jgi:uncharacterized repeat protein (TIGR03803 family)